MHFAFKTSPQDTTWDAMLEVWQAADDIEVFESGWTSDHFYAIHDSDPSAPRLEGWTTLTALAQATTRLRLGTLVTGVHHRHPTVLANMAATLDIVSGGRPADMHRRQRREAHNTHRSPLRAALELRRRNAGAVQPGAECRHRSTTRLPAVRPHRWCGRRASSRPPMPESTEIEEGGLEAVTLVQADHRVVRQRTDDHIVNIRTAEAVQHSCEDKCAEALTAVL